MKDILAKSAAAELKISARRWGTNPHDIMHKRGVNAEDPVFHARGDAILALQEQGFPPNELLNIFGYQTPSQMNKFVTLFTSYWNKHHEQKRN